MTHDRIEFEEPEESVCDCCGGATTSLTRFVTRDGDAFAVYFAKFSNNHPEGWVSVLVGLGDWSEDTDSSQRTAFAFRIWTTDTNYQVGLVDADEDDWQTEFLGRKLTRTEALDHPLRLEVFKLSDHIVECDQTVISYLNRSGENIPSTHSGTNSPARPTRLSLKNMLPWLGSRFISRQ